ncbi:hypothetical protein [Paraburkholderia terrae]|uniref:hypothetical protein n=1 Tax=Paraburkholderia terrae TaxID=311230 RepID=UPI00336535DE
MEKETTIVADRLMHLFQFNGFNRNCKVLVAWRLWAAITFFFADVTHDSIARPSNAGDR